MHERDLFIAALEIDDETARQAYLDKSCAGDSALRARVERLLSRAGEASDTGKTILLNQTVPVAPAASPPVAAPSPSGVVEEASPFGTLFGRYRVERVLGSGGMGVVYLAEDLRLGRRVALKIPKFDADDKFHLIERFRREARTMASVLHRNLCPIFDVDEQEGTHYLTMAFIDGESLSQIIKREQTAGNGSRETSVRGDACSGSRETSVRTLTSSATKIAELIRKLALALDEAHRAGVVHRDLKPANVMIDRSGEPILMDFGLAWMVHETDARVTQSGAIVGTPAYMSPEQAEGDPAKVGAASDIYSLGAILYELLTGRQVHVGGVTRVLFKLVHEAPTRPSEIRGNVDRQLEAICWKAIARRPEDRFASAAEFAAALASYLDDRPPDLSSRVTAGRNFDSSSDPIVLSDRTELLPQDTDNATATIAYRSAAEPQRASRGSESPENVDPESPVASAKPLKVSAIGRTPTGSPTSMALRGRSRIVLASLLLIGVLGGAWAIIDSQTKPAREDIVQSQPQVPKVDLQHAAPEAHSKIDNPPVIAEQSTQPAVPLKLDSGAQLPSVTSATGLKLGDLDGDGDLDLFVVMLKAPCLVFRNDGKGSFTDSGQRLGDNASFAVALGDLDGDGHRDAFVCNSDKQENAIWLNDGRGTFRRSTQVFSPNDSNDVALADVDGDKDLDIVVSNWNGFVEIWNNDGTGQFTSQQTIPNPGNTGIALGDLDRDGHVDLVMTSIRGINHVWLNDGQGQFTDSQQEIEHVESTSVALGDLDQDGDLDLLFTGHQGNQVWFNDSHGHFQASEQLLGDGKCEAVELVDLDADHDLDAVTIAGGWSDSGPRFTWQNDGHGRFTKGPALAAGNSQSLASGDLDGDGDADVVFGNLSQLAEVWLNQSNQSTIP